MSTAMASPRFGHCCASGASVEGMNTSIERTPRLLAFGFESWRVGVLRWLLVTAALVVAYWVLWVTDRSVVATDHSADYIAFEQSFPLADGWLLAALLAAGVQLWRRQPSALL